MGDLQQEIILIAQLFLSSSGFAFWVGLMISIAIFLGYFVFDDVEKMWKWLLVFVIYLVFQELMRSSYLSMLPASEHVDPFRPVFLVIVSSVLFGTGLAIGGLISRRSKNRRKIIRKKTDEIIANIKSNGTINTDKENCIEGCEGEGE